MRNSEAVLVYPDTYSQYDEQQAILAYHIKTPWEGSRFLDIGAWDPKTFSNTRALFERGWGGVLIEPSPGPLRSLLKEYGAEPRVEIVQGVVGVEAGLVKHFAVTDDSVSTADPEKLAEWRAKGGYYGEMTVLAITWAQINNWWGGFDFVNIDAEGTSVDLFHAMVGSGALPSCVCCEHDGTRMSELCAAATAAGYKLLYSNGTNGVFGR